MSTTKQDQEQTNEDLLIIRVIGADRKFHMAEPHKDTCLCGMKILSKNSNTVQVIKYSCYECTY